MEQETLSYQEQIERWRRHMEDSLRAEDGWLALAGLFWLQEGSNRVGADPDAEIVLPATAAPLYIGTITLTNGQASFTVADDVAVTLNGEAVAA